MNTAIESIKSNLNEALTSEKITKWEAEFLLRAAEDSLKEDGAIRLYSFYDSIAMRIGECAGVSVLYNIALHGVKEIK